MRLTVRMRTQMKKQSRRMARIAPSTKSKNHLSVITTLPRKQAALLFQLRTGHSALNSHLSRIDCSPSAICPLGDVSALKRNQSMQDREQHNRTYLTSITAIAPFAPPLQRT